MAVSIEAFSTNRILQVAKRQATEQANVCNRQQLMRTGIASWRMHVQVISCLASDLVGRQQSNYMQRSFVCRMIGICA